MLQVRSKMGKFNVLEARKDGTKFTNTRLKKMGDRRIALDASYEAQQKALVERVVEVASSFSEIFLQVKKRRRIELNHRVASCFCFSGNSRTGG